jgi:tetratricopeptide (TPR) repeat protein
MSRLSTIVTAAVVLLLVSACGSASDLSKAETQRSFGIRMARMNLWREAEFRFRRAVEIDPADAQARNNLAVALEANGDFEGAMKEYREALRLDRTNEHIQKNYSRLVEFTQKSKRRETPATAKPPAAAPAASPTPPTAESPSAPPADMPAPPAEAPPAREAPPQKPPHDHGDRT